MAYAAALFSITSTCSVRLTCAPQSAHEREYQSDTARELLSLVVIEIVDLAAKGGVFQMPWAARRQRGLPLAEGAFSRIRSLRKSPGLWIVDGPRDSAETDDFVRVEVKRVDVRLWRWGRDVCSTRRGSVVEQRFDGAYR